MMEDGWEARSGLVRAAVALTVLALLPVAALSLSAPAHASPNSITVTPGDSGGGPLHGTSGLDAPTVDALMRGWQAGLFASFGWDGNTARGSFVEFAFSPTTGTISSFLARQENETLAIVGSIGLDSAADFASPTVTGPLFTATSSSMTIIAHDDPAGLLEFHTGSAPRSVVFHFIPSLTNVTDRFTSASWPQAALSFSVGESRGSLLLGAGNFNVSGTTVVATMTANDFLVMRVVPGFSSDRPQRSAVLDAFASGRLEAEYALVAKSDGGWIQNAARYRADLDASATTVEAGHATLWFRSLKDRGGLLLLAFDPLTMPVDQAHRLAVTVNGTEIPQATDVMGTFYGSPDGIAGPFYARLSVNATVLAIYLPTFRASIIEVSSIALAQPTADWITEAATVAALGVVSVAAAVMFRRRET